MSCEMRKELVFVVVFENRLRGGLSQVMVVNERKGVLFGSDAVCSAFCFVRFLEIVMFLVIRLEKLSQG